MRVPKKLAVMARKAMYELLDATELYVPLEAAKAFHRCDVKWRILDGSNRSGKTLAAAVEVARAVSGRDPYDKYIHHNGKAIIVGLDTEHLSTLYRKLFEPGAFKIVFDAEKNQFRPLRVVTVDGKTVIDPADLEAKDDWVDAPPLIPARYVSSISWYDFGRRVPSTVRLKNGWLITFRSSQGRAPQGEHWDLAWIDEAVANDAFFYEISRGIVDLGSAKKSKAIWSACPQIPNYQLWELRREAEGGSNRVKAFRLTIEDNPYCDEEEKRLFFESLTPTQRLTRYYGFHAIDTLRAYPYFQAVEPWVYDPKPIPEDWTVYMGLDPGTRRCGTVLAAVPPRGEPIHVFRAFSVAGGVEPWIARLSEIPEARRIHMVICDPVAGKSRQLTGLATVARIYYDAMAAAGVRPEISGPLDGFFSGERNCEVRRELLNQGFRPREDGSVRIIIARETTESLAEEIMSALLPSGKDRPKNDHSRDLLDALEYLYAANPVYKSRSKARASDEAEAMYARFLKERASRRGTLTYLPGLEVRQGVLL